MPELAKAPIVRIGDVLDGKYVVERVLGAGGMGVVVAARQLGANRLVALKYITPEHMGEREHVERFAREAKASVRLASTHAVRIFDVGRFGSGAPYMVMEYLDGQDLSDLVERRGPLPAEVAVDYTLQACEAIAEAHAYGIVHRDLKPRNLFLTTDSTGRPHVKVLDFGIAKSLVPLVDGASSITRTTAIVGSPQYMSPEQMRSSKDVDTRTDIWSLGATLFELLTANVAFDGNTVAEICAKVLAAPAPTLRRYRGDLPEALERVVSRCLEKEQALRFADVYQLALALTPFAPRAAQGAASRISAVLYAPPTTCVVKPPPSSGSLATTMPMFENGGSLKSTHVMAHARRSTPQMPAAAASSPNGASLESAAMGVDARAPGSVARFLAFAVAACAAATAIVLLLTGHRHKPLVDTASTVASQEPQGPTTLVLAPTPAVSQAPLELFSSDRAAVVGVAASNAAPQLPVPSAVHPVPPPRQHVGAPPAPPQVRPSAPTAAPSTSAPSEPPKPPKPSETF